MAPKQPVAGPSRIKASQPASSPPPPSSVGAYNTARTHFALALPVLGTADKVTVWDVVSDRVVAEWEIDGAAKASTVSWAAVPSTDSASGAGKKKKAKRDSVGSEDVVVVTTTEGVVLVYSPKRGMIHRWSLPSTATAASSGEHGILLASASSIYLLSPDASSIAQTFALPPHTPAPTAISVLASSTANVLQVLIASTSAIILQLNLQSGKISNSSSRLAISTSTISSAVPLPSSSSGTSFLVVSEDDRAVSQYTIPTNSSAPKLSYRFAPPTLSPAHSIATSAVHLAVLHVSGEISIFPLPIKLDLARPKTDSSPSIVKLVEGKAERQLRSCRVEFASNEDSPDSILCGRMSGGGRVQWVRATFKSTDGTLKPEITIRCDAQDLVSSSADSGSTPLQRFVPPSSTADAIDTDMADDETSALPADVDMADMSLGERLLALPNGNGALPNGDASDSEPSSPKLQPTALDGTVNAASLTRVLVQALHTSDPALLSMCLDHRDPALIRNTIRKMPASMALPLLKACVERLGQGKGAARRGGGRGGGQSEQQGRGTVEWVKGVLVERGSILMTMPSLPQHLATLSNLLQTRLALHQPLLSLSGRLDLALAQIQLRRLALEQSRGGKDRDEEGFKYVEGESDDEDDVAIEYGEDGVIEDVDMRVADFDEDDEDDEEDEDSEEDEDDDDEVDLESDDDEAGGRFLDLEAEEDSDEESDDD